MIELGSEEEEKIQAKASSGKYPVAQAKNPAATLPSANELASLIGFRVQLKRQIQGFRGSHSICGLAGCRDCELALSSQFNGGSFMQSFEEISGVLRGVRSITGSGKPIWSEVQYHIALDQGAGVLLRSMIQGDLITVYGFTTYSSIATPQELKPGLVRNLNLFAEYPKSK